METKKTNWYKDAVIYQIYPRSFKDSNDDGFGDIPGIISKLDYLKELGVNCVWLSPVYPSPQEDNGYDISNYYNIYDKFGTLDDFKQMLNEMHKRGIRLIMDLVVNHTSSEHAYFKDLLKDPEHSKYRDYYIVRKGKKNGKKPPNNWSGFFGEKAWERLPNSDLYYLHLFAKGQPDLNWENPKVREEVKNILRYWFDMGVDGFRCDVITLISKKQDFKNRFPGIALVGKDAYINGPRLHEFLHELNKDVISKYDVMTVGETVLSSIEDAKLLVAPSREELTMIFNFDNTDTDNYLGVKYLERKFDLRRLKKVYRRWQAALHNNGWNSLFIENHDQRRSTGRFGTDESDTYRELSAKCLASAYFLMQGTPFIYEGQEIGMTNYHFTSPDQIEDVEFHNIYNVTRKNKFIKFLIGNHLFENSRDNARTPMQWDNSEYAGFSNVAPWLAVNPNKDKINAKDSLAREDSLFHYYQKLISFRVGNEIIKNGKFNDVLPHHKYLFIYEMAYENKKVVVMTNFSKKTIKHKLISKYNDSNLVLSNYSEHDESSLKPYEARIYEYN